MPAVDRGIYQLLGGCRSGIESNASINHRIGFSILKRNMLERKRSLDSVSVAAGFGLGSVLIWAEGSALHHRLHGECYLHFPGT